MAKTPVLNYLARKKKTHERLRELWCLFVWMFLYFILANHRGTEWSIH